MADGTSEVERSREERSVEVWVRSSWLQLKSPRATESE